MLFYGIYHWRLLTKNLMKRKLYSIALTKLRYKTLAMLGIKNKLKLGGVIHWVELEDKSGGKRKARPDGIA